MEKIILTTKLALKITRSTKEKIMKKILFGLAITMSIQGMAIEPIKEERGIACRVVLEKDEYMNTPVGNVIKMELMKEILDQAIDADYIYFIYE